MKSKLLILSILSLSVLIGCKSTQYATDCSVLQLDLKKGTLNNVKPTASPEEVKAAFTCFTGETEEGSGFNCGGGVFFLDHDFYFYTHRNYIEVRSKFNFNDYQTGIMGKNYGEVKARYGKPTLMPEENIYLYEMPYGTLRFEFLGGEVNKIGIHADKPVDVELCL